MEPLSELYQEVILDHNKNPRNFGKLTGANRAAEGYNPLCGDKIHLYLKVVGDRIEEVRFEGSGCAISKASSSMMTTVVKGKRKEEAEAFQKKFHTLLTADLLDTGLKDDLEKLGIFAGVRDFPTRVKCATLAWHTLKAALEGSQQPVSTEGDETSPPNPLSLPALSEVEGTKRGGEEELKEKVIDILETCYDPEIPVNIYELGLVYEVDAQETGDVEVIMTLTSPACPVAGSLPGEVEQKIRRIPGIRSAKVSVVWDPPWTPEKMSEAARLQLGI